MNDTDARLWRPWLRINRVLRVMLHTRWTAEAWSIIRGEFVGEAGKIRAMVVRKTKTDRRDARHLLDLLKHDRFPTVGMPDPETRVENSDLLLSRVKITSDECHESGLLPGGWVTVPPPNPINSGRPFS